ncbi:unnamed protein product [Schistosoma mattheei]|uniref:Uncharacterized protein n=1 Tax=Schistosoma mattheei TaxID=31246 RepID=A0A183NQD7_9TREM|nr:unnamed protein product [Schistosoma mattheei]
MSNALASNAASRKKSKHLQSDLLTKNVNELTPEEGHDNIPSKFFYWITLVLIHGFTTMF